jgi:hypothetical protein
MFAVIAMVGAKYFILTIGINVKSVMVMGR